MFNIFSQFVGNTLRMDRIYESPRYYGRGLCLKAKNKAKDLGPENKNLRARRVAMPLGKSRRGKRQAYTYY